MIERLWTPLMSLAYDRTPDWGATAPIGVVFLGESLAPTTWIGLVCVIAGVAAMTLPVEELVARSQAGDSTAFDTLVLKAALFAIEQYFDDHHAPVRRRGGNKGHAR